MRDIKFRYWDPVYHDPVNGQMIYSEVKGLKWFFKRYQEAVDLCNNPTLMQFTGLQDANGKDIYEGDLVRGNWSDKINPMIVDFESPSFIMRINNQKWSEFNIVGKQPYIIIGNIYETEQTAV